MVRNEDEHALVAWQLRRQESDETKENRETSGDIVVNKEARVMESKISARKRVSPQLGEEWKSQFKLNATDV